MLKTLSISIGIFCLIVISQGLLTGHVQKDIVEVTEPIVEVVENQPLQPNPISAPNRQIIHLTLNNPTVYVYPNGIEIATDSRDVIQFRDIDIFCMAKNIFHEAGTEPDEGKYAVAQITINRVKSMRYPNTICDVVMEPYQFSWANDRSIRWTRPSGPNWEASFKIAEEVLHSNYRFKGLERSHYYHANYVRPQWARNMTRVATVGNHIFYENYERTY